jgi:hypothetical protein
MVMRIAALVVLLSLVAPSVSRIVCGWDCIEQRNTAQAASCHEHEGGDGDTLASGSSTTCHDDHSSIVARGASSNPNSAALVDIGAPLYSRTALSSRAIVAGNASAPPTTRLTFVQLRI